jgi:hypothetical protein
MIQIADLLEELQYYKKAIIKEIKKMKTFNFEYSCVVRRVGEDINVVGYNSPYPPENDKQSIDDIKYALLEQKVVDTNLLEENKKYHVLMNCKFVENIDGTYNQLFTLNECKEK